jgi:hypothetical protein
MTWSAWRKKGSELSLPWFTGSMAGSLCAALVSVFLLPSAGRGQDRAAIKAAEAACGPFDVNLKARFVRDNDVQAQAPRDRALVYVIYPQHQMRLHIDVAMDGKWVGDLRSRSHLVEPVSPGTHHFCARMRGHALFVSFHSAALLPLTVEAGQTYYLLVSAYFPDEITPGFPTVLLQKTNTDEGYLQLVTTPKSETLGSQP